VAEINRLEEAYNWNITRLADAFGLHRDTVRKRLRDAGVVPAGNRSNANVYALKDAGPALFGEARPAGTADDPDDLIPSERKDWYQSENLRVKLEKEMRLLVPVEEAHREMSALAKAVASGLDSLADMLERDAGLPPEAIELVEQTTDALREQMYQSIIIEDDSDDG
jgi:ParB-like chromosome segregation protein Spo0J